MDYFPASQRPQLNGEYNIKNAKHCRWMVRTRLYSVVNLSRGVDRPAERFRVLNGLEAHAQVRLRDRVKIVVD
jgi:predicted Zn-dependent protease